MTHACSSSVYHAVGGAKETTRRRARRESAACGMRAPALMRAAKP